MDQHMLSNDVRTRYGSGSHRGADATAHAAKGGAAARQPPEYVFDTNILQTEQALFHGLNMPVWFKGYKMHPLQLMVGGPMTGAPMHFHISAWNALVFGRKRWAIRPPNAAVFSTVPAYERFEPPAETGSSSSSGSRSSSNDEDDDGFVRHCIQEGGDILFIPSSYSHAVYNLEASAAVAVEFYAPLL